MQADGAQGAYAADAEQDFLLQTILPVSAIELICNLAVFGNIVLEVCVEKVKVCASHGNLPDPGVKLASGKLAAHSNPLAVGAGNGLGRDLEEVLRIVFRHLVALRGDFLGKIAVTVEEAHCYHVDVHVAAFLEVVAGKDSETSGINLER